MAFRFYTEPILELMADTAKCSPATSYDERFQVKFRIALWSPHFRDTAYGQIKRKMNIGL